MVGRLHGIKIVIIEDIDPSHKHMAQDMKLWLDHHPFVDESKGSSSVIPPIRIHITSNYNPAAIFERQADQEAICRRFKLVKKEKDIEINLDQ
jgi:hypothetical protein